MRVLRPILLTTLTLLLIASTYAATPFMPRTPAISPDGNTIVFGFQGDLWSVDAAGGRAVRLTANPAWDGAPLFSPDGKWIAFASDRYGDKDLFLIPADGGTPTRLTYASTNDFPAAFSPDGSQVYFIARRLAQFPMNPRLWVVPVGGGTPMPTSDLFVDEADIALDGTMILGIGRYKFGRLHYRGTYQRDIYAQKPGADPIALTTHPGYDIRPQVGGDSRAYWLSDADETMTRNVWSSQLDGSDLRQETHFEGMDIRSFTIADGGNRMILEAGTDIYLFNPDSEPKKMKIEVADDLLENPVVYVDKSSGANELELSGDGEELAMVVDGDVIVVNQELGGRARVVLDGPSREQQIAFRPGDEETELLAVTDASGEQRIVKISAEKDASLKDSKTLKIEDMTDGSQPSRKPIWSPDGERFLYTLGNGDLHVMDENGKHDKLLLARWRQQWHPLDYTWSPDGKWVALSAEDEDYNSDIWILPSDGSGSPVNITKHPNYDLNPVWSADGRSLAWSSDRSNRQFDVYAVYLRKEDDERTKEEWEIWEKTRDKKSDDEEKEDKDKAPEVKIDFDEIYLRARRMTSLPGEEFAVAIHPQGDKYFFTTTINGDNDLYSVNRFGKELTEITSGNTRPGAIFLVDGTFHFLKSGVPATVSMDGGSIETTDFEARLTLDKQGRRLQAFDEGWRMMRDFFYDPKMHGVDWMAVKAKYEPWVKQVRHDEDFADLVNLMLGELNASHMGYYAGWSRSSDTDGWLGLEFDPSYIGEGLKVARVLENSPSDKVASKLMPGDILLKVNGLEVSNTQNYWRTLEKRQNMPTEVVFKRGKKEITVETTPVGWRAIYGGVPAEYEKNLRKEVEEATDGKVGYVYIRGMSWAEVERFEMNLYAAAHGKDALIIDVRDNGGGWTTDFMMNILTQPEHAFTVGRDGKPGYPQSERQIFYRWLKPISVLCDESSYSNAEIFSHAIKTTGRGPVIGNTTGGNVISTGGWFTQIPDAWIRMPQRGWYVWGDKEHPERNGLNEEGNGAVPDYLIVRTPADVLNGRDPQLDKAIELMKQAAADYEAQPKPTPKP